MHDLAVHRLPVTLHKAAGAATLRGMRLVPIIAINPALEPTARALAARAGLPYASAPVQEDALVCASFGDDYRIEFQLAGPQAPGAVFVDFLAGRLGYRRMHGGGKNQPLARAVGIKGQDRPRVLDVTGGLARDAFVLATLGCEVTIVERHPAVFLLLEDGIRRAFSHQQVGATARRMRALLGDGRDVLASLRQAEPPDVVYMDPMYPHRRKSALVKKEMRALRALVGDDADSADVLAQALRCLAKRIVVKRPSEAPPLAGTVPSATVGSPNTRYDIYVLGR